MLLILKLRDIPLVLEDVCTMEAMLHTFQILLVKSVSFTMSNVQIELLYSQFMHNFSPSLPATIAKE